MKKVLLEVGKALVTLAIIAEAIYLLFTTPKYWPGVIVLAAILYMWIQVVYHLFGKMKLTKNGFEFENNARCDKSTSVTNSVKKEIDTITNRLSKLENKFNHHKEQSDLHFNNVEKELDKFKQQIASLSKQVAMIKANEKKNLRYSFESLNVASDSNRLSLVGADYESPESLSRFVELKSKAKENEYDLKGDPNYNALVVRLTNEILSNLGMSTKIRMQENHTNDLLNLDFENDICKVYSGKEVDFETLAAIQNQVEKVDSDPNIPISFSKAKSDLKKTASVNMLY
ncbi:MAG: hypothetical protein H9806_04010 [Candidatus Lactobacillus pullistercoris]|uniref:Uncharacterized protein n=1 Tax=Candidatus Lactobacillus pullistercoris TaxID=2838636 RepID=A0A9E2KQK9_9LACO|nr:hypothetical protein [Candidatus Lactobacillus pullistercoris]